MFYFVCLDFHPFLWPFLFSNEHYSERYYRGPLLAITPWQPLCPELCRTPCKLHLWTLEPWTKDGVVLSQHVESVCLSPVPVRMAALSFHVESVVLRPNCLRLLDKNVGEKELHCLALSITCHKQHAVFNIQNKTSLSHSRRPFWQKPSHSCQEYRVQLRTNFKMNLKSICHQIFMPLPDYLWHFNYKHPRRGVLQILTLGSYNKLYWQPLSACSTNPE